MRALLVILLYLFPPLAHAQTVADLAGRTGEVPGNIVRVYAAGPPASAHGADS